MSAYTEQKTQINDVDLLKKCLEEKGYKDVEVHDTPQQLVGYHGDLRQQKAEVIIRRKNIGSASNDIGFAKQKDGSYAAIISDFDKGRHNAAWMSDLKKNYATKKIQKVAKANGLTLLSTKPTTTGGVRYQFLKA